MVGKTNAEAREMLKDKTPPAICEQLANQLKTSRDARAKIERDGIIVADSRGTPVDHPALKVEAAADKRVSNILRQWGRK